MSNNDNNIEKRSFEAFVNAIGSEIEQAQVRLISAANAQMLKERVFGQELGLYVPVRTLLSIGRITEFYRNRCEITYSKCAENHG